mmetsp:Transcript_57994/g.66945  ORF Transcript_57994/g.66945 Transcript_57994/m.66945 type:complete len:167 (+) Transcript_57994:345-845(+)
MEHDILSQPYMVLCLQTSTRQLNDEIGSFCWDGCRDDAITLCNHATTHGQRGISGAIINLLGRQQAVVINIKVIKRILGDILHDSHTIEGADCHSLCDADAGVGRNARGNNVAQLVLVAVDCAYANETIIQDLAVIKSVWIQARGWVCGIAARVPIEISFARIYIE